MNLDHLESLCLAATPGPWRWEINLHSKDVKLCGSPPRYPAYDHTVMDFVRWGMRSAAPRFRTNDCLMRRCDETTYAVAGREHHKYWFQGVNAPDAAFMEALDPTTCRKLIRAARILDSLTKFTYCPDDESTRTELNRLLQEGREVLS